jgi:hypothetical protein
LDGGSVKIIIDKNNPITVEDQDGNVLFDYQPTTIKDLENMTLDDLAAFLTKNR